jgi:hypothetical protein
MKRTTPLAAMAAVVVALAACGGNSSGGSVSPGPSTGTDEVVVRVVTSGGFAAESRQPAELPQLSVFRDGRVITEGPTTLQYPGPALPNLQEYRLTDEGRARINDEARDLGLLDDPSPDFGDPGITDQPTTTVTVSVDGRTRRVNVYALDFDEGLTAEQRDNRRRLQQFIGAAGHPHAVGVQVVPGSIRRFEPLALAVLVRPSDATEGTTRAWPLGDLAGADCAVFTGSDLAAVLDAARDAREGDPWSSGNATYRLTFRPLLPDERTCDDVAR